MCIRDRCNISPDYERVIRNGLELERKNVEQMLEGADETQQEFLSCVIDSIDAVIGFSDRYRQAALEAGNLVAADILTRVPRQEMCIRDSNNSFIVTIKETAVATCTVIH